MRNLSDYTDDELCDLLELGGLVVAAKRLMAKTKLIATLDETVNRQVALIAAKDAEIKRLREALGVFADPASWWQLDCFTADGKTSTDPAAFARQALEHKP